MRLIRPHYGCNALNSLGGSLHLKSRTYLSDNNRTMECGKLPRVRMSQAWMNFACVGLTVGKASAPRQLLLHCSNSCVHAVVLTPLTYNPVGKKNAAD